MHLAQAPTLSRNHSVGPYNPVRRQHGHCSPSGWDCHNMGKMCCLDASLLIIYCLDDLWFVNDRLLACFLPFLLSPFLPSFPASFLSLLPSFLPSFLSYLPFLPSFPTYLPSFLPSFLPFLLLFLHSFIPSFLPYLLPSFLSCFFSFIPS